MFGVSDTRHLGFYTIHSIPDLGLVSLSLAPFIPSMPGSFDVLKRAHLLE